MALAELLKRFVTAWGPTTITGTLGRKRSSLLTLPRRSWVATPRPRRPTTMMAAFSFSTIPDIAVAGRPFFHHHAVSDARAVQRFAPDVLELTFDRLAPSVVEADGDAIELHS